ncbi:oxidoreductase, 2OG-Fe(II) oxygenase family protein [Beauveria bassiana ARSEF 2860]|uniref:Oxidoreductase, 2OG-Fe(II) oxygenase family protein n=1 Tax=Beauveria bassiana (strain ARSEF 2860) TaxID=655819 RepID=J5JAG7_BEAB2|nr:oxidoreductase, 2OG-Fe(II) oxygenase family protein [Beauveria bassiana ARSEF 2860]EJP63178.1 oxidoreductase, 2OG-Fe(II) oxygenase family protein [Beauveria bassiana ARSEF 2860]
MSSRPALTPVLVDFKNALAEQKHFYACGGRISIATPTTVDGEAEARSSTSLRTTQSKPVTIRWDLSNPPHGGLAECKRVTLPITQQRDRDALDSLRDDCKPATFGLNGKDVLDETYRKALKMDTELFCTTFDPYSLGIVDTVTQMLLPSFEDPQTHRAVDARLYKLNIYSGPSGMFKAHVDTPRSAAQFGSLVVCLPAEHHGGQLKVRHKGEETTFDWSTPSDESKLPHIEWAAFYSDCEHEVMEVSSGHRLTLTYNLYAVPGTRHLTGRSSVLDPTRLPLHSAIERLISDDPLCGKGLVFEALSYQISDQSTLTLNAGGTLGFWCSHAYAYNDTREAPLPETLKGIDASVWESFRALGIEVKIAPIIRMEDDVRNSIAYFHEWEKARERKREPRKRCRLPSKFIVGNKFGYGNEGSAGAMYSHCAILASLPSKTSKDSATTA